MLHLFPVLLPPPPLPALIRPLSSPARWVANGNRSHFKMCLLLLLVAIGGRLDAAAQSTPPTVRFPHLSKTLDSLFYVDQWPMQRMLQQQSDSAGRNLVQVEEENFARHQPVLERIIRQYGYPGFQQVGQKSANHFFYLVQHADAHPAFQRQVLQLMRPEVKRKNASPADYAYLTDRIARNAGQLSEYGTQVTYEGTGPTIRAVARPLRDPTHVNKRRAAVGLEPLETYLDNMTNVTRQMNAPKAPAK